MIDLTDTEAFTSGEVHARFESLRRSAPVHWNATPDGPGFWAITRFADVLSVYDDDATFSSAHGPIVGGSFGGGRDTASGQMLVASDPPAHRRLRRKMLKLFTRTLLEQIRRTTEQNVARALDDMWRAGGGDFAADIAPVLPMSAAMVLFDIGEADARHLIALTRAMIGYRDDHSGADETKSPQIRLAAAQAEIIEFFYDLAEERRRSPGADAVSVLLSDDGSSSRLREDEVLLNLLNLAVGGNETTPHSATVGMHAFIQHPEEWGDVRSGKVAVPTAVGEVVRWASTNAYVQRVATRDCAVGGVSLPEGSVLTLWNASANRDESHFSRAGAFCAGRVPNDHLAFGHGIHRCIGAGAATVELTTLFDALRSRPETLELAGDVVRLRSNFMLGVQSLPVQVRATEGAS